MQFTFNLRTPSIVSKYWWNKSNLNQGRLTDALLLRTTIQWFPLLLSLFLLWLAILSSTSEIQIVSRGKHWIMVDGKGASVSRPWFKLDFCGDNWWCPYNDLRWCCVIWMCFQTCPSKLLSVKNPSLWSPLAYLARADVVYDNVSVQSQKPPFKVVIEWWKWF